VPKPLPLTDEGSIDRIADPAIADFAREQQRAGIERLRRIREWGDQVAEADPLAAWLTAPSLSRLSFANLHAPVEDDDPPPEAATDGTVS
jgi:hypothetical protein